MVSILCLESKDTAACDGAAPLYDQGRKIHLQLQCNWGLMCPTPHTPLSLR